MEIKTLDRDEIAFIYEKYMKQSFPAAELKPLSAIYRYMDRNEYVSYGLYENGELRAYGCYFEAPEYYLLDYLAVLPDIKGSGYGSAFLGMVKSELKKPVLAEVERPECGADEDDVKMRRRRIHFYEKNGFLMTNVKTTLFGVKYHIMKQGEEISDNDEKAARSVYMSMFGDRNVWSLR